MIRAYDENGNIVDLVEWEKQIRADAIDEFVRMCEGTADSYISIAWIKKISEQLKEKA